MSRFPSPLARLVIPAVILVGVAAGGYAAERGGATGTSGSLTIAGSQASPVASLAASPAASPGATPSTAGAATLEAVDIAWNQTALTVPVGGTINLINLGDSEHNFVLEGYAPLEQAPVDMPIDRTVIPYVLPADVGPGTYVYYCNVPGHQQLMRGTMTVQ